MSTDVVSVRLPAELKRRLDALSAETGRPAAHYLREALDEHLSDLEYAYGIATRAEAVRAGTIETIPLDQVMSELGITDAELAAVAPEPDVQ